MQQRVIYGIESWAKI